MRACVAAILTVLCIGGYALGAETQSPPPNDCDAEATKWFRKAAEQGDVMAQYNLGIMYDVGRGVTQDYAEAVKWYGKAADQGDAKAQYNLGLVYVKGQGVAQDNAGAVKWYRNAAEQGNVAAQTFLGNMYKTGRGVTQDYVQAHMWFNLVAAKGEETARKGRDLVAEKMTPAQIAEAQRLAREWRPKKP